MRRDGWVGEPVEVAATAGDLYIINGHHRVAAAKRAGINVPYRILGGEELRTYRYGAMDEVIAAWMRTGPNRLR